MKAVAFDLGDTLVEYEGLPLSWEKHYSAALGNLARQMDVPITPETISAGCEILRRYNTRIYPRTREVNFEVILSELLTRFGGDRSGVSEKSCAEAFFRIFRQRLRCFSDTRPALARLREAGWHIGIFTDVPYGMGSELVREDLLLAGLADDFDVLITSRDVGWRKPEIKTLQALAEALGSSAEEMAYVGNERKDVEVARAFGCRSVCLDRTRSNPDWGQDRTIESLDALPLPEWTLSRG